MGKKDPGVIWYERKRNWCGTPFTFTTYTLTADELIIKEGFVHEHTDIIKTYRILDASLDRTFGQRCAGLSTIKLDTMDHSTGGEAFLANIPKGKEVLRLVTDTAEESRRRNGVTAREFYGGKGPRPGGPEAPGAPDPYSQEPGDAPYGPPDDLPEDLPPHGL